jgi:hypothetical protein
VPAPPSTHTSQVLLPPTLTSQNGAAFMQPASVPLVSVSAQGTHASEGAPEQTSPPVHMPISPAATDVLVQAFATHSSAVQATLSSQCAAVVQGTH